MKKENRLLKIHDNFSTVEIYLTDDPPRSSWERCAAVMVRGRTFSGSYTVSLELKELRQFGEESLKWYEKLPESGEGPFPEHLTFSGGHGSLELDIAPVSTAKVCWNITCRPFLPEIEVLRLAVETESALVRSIHRNIEKTGAGK